MTKTNGFRNLTLSILAFGLVFGAVNLSRAQTKQLKQPATPQVVDNSGSQAASSASIAVQPGASQSYSVVIENQTQPDGKVLQSKKVWQDGKLVEETTTELDGDDAQNSLNATIQLPNGQIANGDAIQLDDSIEEDEDDFFSSSPFESIRKMEEQMRRQQERMRKQFDQLRSQLGANGGFQAPSPRSFRFSTPSETLSKYWLGLTIDAVPDILIAQMPIDEESGALVEYVAPDSPAAKANLKRYDVIVKIGDKEIKEPADVSKIVDEIGAQKVKIQFYRKGALQDAEVEISERPKTFAQQFNLNNFNNKKLRVVRPGLIIPADQSDSEEGVGTPEQTEQTEKTNEVETPSGQAEQTEKAPEGEPVLIVEEPDEE